MTNDMEQQNAFISFYKKVLSEFLNEKNLKIVDKYSSVKIESDFSQYKSGDRFTNHLSLSQLQSMDMFGYEKDIIEFVVKKANPEQKEIVLKNNYDLFYTHNLIEAVYTHSEDLKTIFKNLGKVKLKDYFWEISIKFLQNHCDNDVYDELMDIVLDNNKSQLKLKQNKIILNLMLNHVKNDEIYAKYNNLIPDNELANDIFDTLDLNYFELNVSKDKLFSSIILPNKDKYNNMHEFFLDKINEDKIKNMLGIFSIEGEVKYKSSKHYRYMCRVKENSSLDKENLKLLVMSVYKLYVHTINNIPEDKREYETLNEMSSEMIHNNYLNYKLSKQTSRTEAIKEKKNKI